MQNIFDSLISNTYQLDTPMPVVSVTELHLHVEKESTYMGAIEVYNSGGGFLLGLVESVNGVVKFKEETLKGNKVVLEYSIDAVQHTGYLVDTVIITYNGGEILLPVHITIEEHSVLHPTKKWIPKAVEQSVTFSMDQLSYHPDETGILTITNPFVHLAKVKLISDDGYLQFKQSVIEVVDTQTVEFTFKITKLDRMLGRVPLKTNPKIEVTFYAEIQLGNSFSTTDLMTYLTELGNFQTTERIPSLPTYKAVVKDTMEQFCAINLSSPKAKYTDELMEKLRMAINYDRTNIELRLFYCFLALENNNKNHSLKEIYDLDRYLIHFDMEHKDVSDILLLFLEMIKGDAAQELVRSWKLKGRENWVKILLKNRVLVYKSSCYDDYRTLYEMGEKNVLIFLEAALLMNHAPVIPSTQDPFYKTLMLWALRKNVLGPKWLKKIESSHHLLIKHGNVTGCMVEKMVALDDNKNIVNFACDVFILEARYDEKALAIYKRALSERIHIMDLEDAYVHAAYQCNEMIHLEYFKIIFNIEKLEERLRAYFLLCLMLQKEQAKGLYQYHFKQIEQAKLGCLKDLMVPELQSEKIQYVTYLMKTEQAQTLIRLFHANKLEDLTEQVEVLVIGFIYQRDPLEGIPLALKAFYKGYYHPQIFDIMGEHYKGKLEQLLFLYAVMTAQNYRSSKIEEEILYKGILTRKHPEQVMAVYVVYSNHLTIQAIHDWMLQYVAAQIIIEDVSPPIGIIKLLETEPALEKDFALSLALLKSYTRYEDKNEAIIYKLINNLVRNGILFSWYELLLPDAYLGENLRIHHYFEYNSQPGRQVSFHYRLDCDEDYKWIQMKHVALGMYVVSLVMFYNEEIQYYIVEKNAEGKKDIKLSDIYVKRDLIEQEQAESLFDLINTIEISKEMKDEVSIERTIENYMALAKKEIAKITIL